VTQPECAFCQILSGNAEASFVLQGDGVPAFLDIRPVTPGHLLVIPNDHVVSLADVAPATLSKMFAVARDLAGAVRRSGIRADGVNLFMADGEAAGQEVWHAHVHVIPRFEGDGFRIAAAAWRGPQPDRGGLDALAERIHAASLR
jgi:histidine triad (HIT) family protein